MEKNDNNINTEINIENEKINYINKNNSKINASLTVCLIGSITVILLFLAIIFGMKIHNLFSIIFLILDIINLILIITAYTNRNKTNLIIWTGILSIIFGGLLGLIGGILLLVWKDNFKKSSSTIKTNVQTMTPETN